jgi:hypothetical protein
MMGTDRRRSDRPDPRAALEAEVVLLREENARLKRHTDPVEQTGEMLVQGLVLRESLIELCRELQHAMALFEARIDALSDAVDQLVPVSARREQG